MRLVEVRNKDRAIEVKKQMQQIVLKNDTNKQVL